MAAGNHPNQWVKRKTKIKKIHLLFFQIKELVKECKDLLDQYDGKFVQRLKVERTKNMFEYTERVTDLEGG